MKVFVKVAESCGFAGAARALHMSPAAVTRAVAALEETIGTRLLIRTTRSVKLTEAGSRYYEDCRRILADIEEAEASAAGAHSVPTGILTVTAALLFGQMYVLPILTEYLQLHPAVTGRSLFVDRIVNIVEEGVDAAVRIGHLPDAGFRARPVGSVRRVVCGAPSYFEKHGVPAQPADLAAHDIVVPTSTWSSHEWRFGRDQKTVVAIQPRLLCNTNEAAISAAMGGSGLTRVLSYQIAPALADGRLQIVLSEFEEAPLPINVVHQEGHRASAKVRTFVELAVARLRANRLINPDS